MTGEPTPNQASGALQRLHGCHAKKRGRKINSGPAFFLMFQLVGGDEDEAAAANRRTGAGAKALPGWITAGRGARRGGSGCLRGCGIRERSHKSGTAAVAAADEVAATAACAGTGSISRLRRAIGAAAREATTATTYGIMADMPPPLPE